MDNLIQLDRVSFRYFGMNKDVLNDISFSVNQGEILGIVGPNGSGKSTLLSLLEGINHPREGKLINNADSMGVVFQSNGYFDNLTVKENINMFSNMYKTAMPYSKINSLVGLHDIENKKLSSLSGGQRQRAFLAFGIVNNPSLLFLDEPTTGLDPENRLNLWNLIRKVAKTVVITSHYMDEVSYLCDRICFVDYGQIYAIGTEDELIRKSKAKGRLQFTVEDKKIIDSIKLQYECTCIDLNRYQILSPNVNEIAHKLLQQFDGEVENIRIDSPTLSDAYYEITGFNLGVRG